MSTMVNRDYFWPADGHLYKARVLAQNLERGSARILIRGKGQFDVPATQLYPSRDEALKHLGDFAQDGLED